MSFPYPNLSRLLQLRRNSGNDESAGGAGGESCQLVMKMLEEPAASVVPPAITEFNKYLQSYSYSSGQAYYNPTTQAPNPSHNNLFGGMYKIEDSSPDIETEFHSMLLSAIRAGGLYGICENRTAYSALYFDLDFKGPPPVPSLGELTSILVLIREVLHRIGGDMWHSQSHALLATSPPQEDLTLGIVKLGAHIIFPNIILDYENLLRVNIACRDYVESMVGIRKAPANTWTDVFDTTMYRTGLRMLFVDKNKKCEICCPADSAADAASRSSRGRPGSKAARIGLSPPSHKCTNGFVGQNRPYVPVKYWHAIHGDDESMQMKLVADPLFALHMATIRKPRIRKPFPCPPTFDASLPTAMETKLCDASARREKSRQEAMGELGEAPRVGEALQATHLSKLSQKIFVDMNDPRMLILQSLIRRYDPERFSSLVIRSVSLNPTLTTYSAHVAGPGRHSCMNCFAERPHSRSTVFFLIDMKQGVTQKCTSRSDKTDRVSHRPCRLFRAPWKPVAKSVQLQLFSNVKTFTSMNLIVDNGNVYVPDWNIVSEEERGLPKVQRIETLDSFSPHRPEASSAVRVSNVNVLEPLEGGTPSALPEFHPCPPLHTNPTTLKIPPTWQKPGGRKRSISQESSGAKRSRASDVHSLDAAADG